MLRALPALLLIALLLFACNDDSTGTGGSGVHTSVSGTLTIQDDASPLSGARVALVDPLPYHVVSGPVTSDAAGHYTLPNPPQGDWYLFVFADSALMFNAGDARVTVQRGRRIQHDVVMIRSVLWGMDRQRIAGTVTDAQTGDPIEGAFVSGLFPDAPFAFIGVTVDSEDMTTEDGRYAVAPVFQLTSAGVIHPLGVSKEGYAPFYMMDVPVPADPDSVYVLDVALVREGRGGALRGKIVDTDGAPVPNLAVALDYTAIPLDTLLGPTASKPGDGPSRVPVLGKTVRTDNKGAFEIEDLAPGTYYVNAAFLADDGYVSSGTEEALAEIVATEVVDMGELEVWPAVVPLSPANGAVVNTPRPTLRWEAVPGATRYQLYAGTGHLLDYARSINGTEFQFDFDIPAGSGVRWHVTAHAPGPGGFEMEIAEFETIQSFTVAE